jgi:hypothetical protein
MRADIDRFWFALASAGLFFGLVLAWWVETQRPEAVALLPTLTGEVEYCLTCHAGLPEISPSHPIESFGCMICHGGERLALDAELAHSSMRGGANPSDLAVVEESCGGGACHAGSEAEERDHIQRVKTSIQATYAGAIASIRYTFDAQADLNAYFGISAVTDPHSATGIPGLAAFDPAAELSPSVRAFGQSCLDCHLSAVPRQDGSYHRLTGCASCHTPTQHPVSEPFTTQDVGNEILLHRLTTAMDYSQCNTCHNRGNYDLRVMEFMERSDQPRIRLEDYYQPIAQFTLCEYTLDCIDCHTRMEAMGDGDIHASQEDIQYVQCKTCHGTLAELPKTRTLTDSGDLVFRLVQLNPVVELHLGDSILVTDQGEPLWNIRLLDDGKYDLVGKASGHRFTFRPVMGTGCQQDLLEQESHYCHECHAVNR